MYTIGTAGHVDHGKSTLITALTGIDPDRLREEKERGLTIDLGFAWLQLPSGREVSIVDVPGHERFVRNMLAGVGGIDAALVVIAADEAVMPQTREHVAILDLLGIKRAVVALTKRDLVEDEWLALVREEIAEELAGTVVERAPVVPVASPTGEGLDLLRGQLDRLLDTTPPKRDLGRPRLPVDRVFTLSGFGTVVTGTLLDGAIELGQELEILPGGRKTRARGLQSHKTKIEQVLPGRRVAINLGGVSTEDLARGAVVATPGWLRATRRLDLRLRLLPDAPRPLRNAAVVSLHTGTTEVVAKVTLLEQDRLLPGAEGWAQLHLHAPLAVVKGDLCIIRQLSPALTLGGGEIVDAHPARRHRRRQPAVVQALDVLARGDPDALLLQMLALKEPLAPEALLRLSGLDQDTAAQALTRLRQSQQVIELGPTLMSAAGWQDRRERLLGLVQSYHVRHPLRPGMSKEELRSRGRLEPRQFGASLARLVDEDALVEQGAGVRGADHEVRLSAPQQATADAFVARLDRSPLAPPGLTELRAHLDDLSDELVEALAAQGGIVRLTDDLCFTPAAYGEMKGMVVSHLQEHGTITVAAVRDRFQTSRRYALALLEYLDRVHVTRRIGDERVLVARR